MLMHNRRTTYWNYYRDTQLPPPRNGIREMFMDSVWDGA